MHRFFPKSERPVAIFIILVMIFLSSWAWLGASVLDLQNRVVTYDSEKSFSPPRYLQNFAPPLAEVTNNSGTEFKIAGSLNITTLSNKVAQVIPDDCLFSIKINGKSVNLEKVKINGRSCDINNGLTLDLSSYLTTGTNRIEFTGLNLMGGYKMQLLPSANSIGYLLPLLIMVASLLGMIMSVVKLTIQDHMIRLIILVAVGLSLMYFGYTNWFERTHDLHGHSDHITMIAENWRFPEIDECWECHQQRPYYIIAAIPLALVRQLGMENYQVFYTFLQIMSLIFMTTFFIFAGKTIEVGLRALNGSNRKSLNLEAYAVLALLLWWPSGIIHSLRIGNDQLFYATVGIFIFYATSYWVSDLKSSSVSQLKAALPMLLAALVAFLVKIIGIVALPAAIIILLLKSIKEQRQGTFLNRITSIPKIILLTSFIMGLLSLTLVLPYFAGSAEITPNKPQDSFKVGNELENYICFRPEIYFGRPEINTFIDEGGRQCFSNIFLKTLIFGEFHIGEDWHRAVGMGLSYILLVVLLAAALRLIQKLATKSGRQQLLIFLPVYILSLFLFAALIYFRWRNPYGSNMDFRYIYPAIISVATLLLPVNKKINWVLVIVLSIWIILTISFILLPALTGEY